MDTDPIAKRKVLTVTVTDEDIRVGKPSEPGRCPVALASRRRLTELGCTDDLSVLTVDTVVISWPGQYCLLSRRCRQWIRRFDNREHVEPATFRVEQMDLNGVEVAS